MDRQRLEFASRAEILSEKIREQGYALIPELSLSPDEMRRTRSFLSMAPVVLNKHVPQIKSHGNRLIPRLDADMKPWDALCVDMPTAIVAPHLFDKGLASYFLALAYLGEPPLVYSMNVFWTRPATGEVRPDIQALHTDADDSKFLAIFFYLTDVLDDAAGPHEIVGPAGNTNRIYGPAGTAFAADTRNMHRGIRPTAGERCLAWFRWGVSDPPESYKWDGNEPIDKSWLGDRYPADPILQNAIKLLVRP